jgi:hypothetical protein
MAKFNRGSRCDAVVFDPDARKEYLTGFKTRKDARRKEAKLRLEEMARDAKRAHRNSKKSETLSLIRDAGLESMLDNPRQTRSVAELKAQIDAVNRREAKLQADMAAVMALSDNPGADGADGDDCDVAEDSDVAAFAEAASTSAVVALSGPGSGSGSGSVQDEAIAITYRQHTAATGDAAVASVVSVHSRPMQLSSGDVALDYASMQLTGTLSSAASNSSSRSVSFAATSAPRSGTKTAAAIAVAATSRRGTKGAHGRKAALERKLAAAAANTFGVRTPTPSKNRRSSHGNHRHGGGAPPKRGGKKGTTGGARGGKR